MINSIVLGMLMMSFMAVGGNVNKEFQEKPINEKGKIYEGCVEFVYEGVMITPKYIYSGVTAADHTVLNVFYYGVCNFVTISLLLVCLFGDYSVFVKRLHGINRVDKPITCYLLSNLCRTVFTVSMLLFIRWRTRVLVDIKKMKHRKFLKKEFSKLKRKSFTGRISTTKKELLRKEVNRRKSFMHFTMYSILYIIWFVWWCKLYICVQAAKQETADLTEALDPIEVQRLEAEKVAEEERQENITQRKAQEKFIKRYRGVKDGEDGNPINNFPEDNSDPPDAEEMKMEIEKETDRGDDGEEDPSLSSKRINGEPLFLKELADTTLQKLYNNIIETESITEPQVSYDKALSKVKSSYKEALVLIEDVHEKVIIQIEMEKIGLGFVEPELLAAYNKAIDEAEINYKKNLTLVQTT